MSDKLSPSPIDACPPDLSDEDIIDAMKDIGGYLDITPGDFKEMYLRAYRHAIERLSSSTQAEDVMTREVVSVRTDTRLQDIAELMTSAGISGVPVIDAHEKVVGMISERDFLSQMEGNDTGSFMGVIALCLANSGCSALSMLNQKAADIMSSPVFTVRETTTVSAVAELFTEHDINRTPVTDKDGKLRGIITRSDIVRTSCAIEPETF
jgi:CBS domain-containing membrane protein